MRCVVILVLGLCLGCGRASTPSSSELTVMMGLAEVEWRVMRERVFPPFEQQHQVRLRGVQVRRGRNAVPAARTGRAPGHIHAQGLVGAGRWSIVNVSHVLCHANTTPPLGSGLADSKIRCGV